jgi:hypothetical protein
MENAMTRTTEELKFAASAALDKWIDSNDDADFQAWEAIIRELRDTLMITNRVYEVDGRRWLIETAVNLAKAEEAIAMARCTGSIGATLQETRDGVTHTLAVVSRLPGDES